MKHAGGVNCCDWMHVRQAWAVPHPRRHDDRGSVHAGGAVVPEVENRRGAATDSGVGRRLTMIRGTSFQTARARIRGSPTCYRRRDLWIRVAWPCRSSSCCGNPRRGGIGGGCSGRPRRSPAAPEHVVVVVRPAAVHTSPAPAPEQFSPCTLCPGGLHGPSRCAPPAALLTFVQRTRRAGAPGDGDDLDSSVERADVRGWRLSRLRRGGRASSGHRSTAEPRSSGCPPCRIPRVTSGVR